MEKMIPYAKLSKKKQKEICSKQRGSWNGVNPVTRKVESKKLYNRKKAQKWNDDPTSVPSLFCFRQMQRSRMESMGVDT